MATNPIATGISTIGTALGIPNFGISQDIAGSKTPVPSLFGVSNAPYNPIGLNTPNYQSNPYPSSSSSGGQVKGASTQAAGPGGAYPIAGGVPTNTSNNTGSYSQSQPQTQQQQTQQTQSDPYAAVRNGISSAWDSYLGSLGGVQSDLSNQQTAQQGIANDQLAAGQNTINSQKAQSLRDIANTTRNAFQAGNNYLGSMGAGDSSAANQYAFAINQQAGKQTGDLNNFVNTQMSQLQSQHDQQINSIANWFSQQQEALKQQIAQGNLSKGQDLNNLSSNILNQAIQATNQIKSNTQNQYNALVQWAANNSGSLGQLQQNISAIPQAMGQINLQGGNMSSTPTYVPGQATTGTTGTKTDIFGNPLPQ